MSKILDLRNAIVNAMDSLTADGMRFQGVHVSSHGGDFDTKAELSRYVKQTPAIVVSVLRSDIGSMGGVPLADCVLAAFVITQDRPNLPRADSAVALADNVLDYVSRFPMQNYGFTEAGKTQNVMARNLYSESFDKVTVAVWGVFWHQTVQLEPPIPPEEPPFQRLHVDWDIAPRDNDAELDEVVDAQDDVILDEDYVDPNPPEEPEDP